MSHPKRFAAKAIADYGAIGNLDAVALVGVDGSIDWCCLPNLGRPSVFAALLDVRRGGRFMVRAEGQPRGRQQYIDDTNVLTTTFQSDGASLEVTDFMPVWGNLEGCGKCKSSAEIHRLLTCRGGDMMVEVEWSPRPDFGRSTVRIEQHEDGWLAWSGRTTLMLSPLESGRLLEDEWGPAVVGRFRMQAGEQRVLVTRWGRGKTEAQVDDTLRILDKTVRAWQEWAHLDSRCNRQQWGGKHADLLDRSALVMKLLTNRETGAMAAASTMGLPMRVGADCNYDYRYSWIRDVALTAQALIALGHQKEAVQAMQWMDEVSASSGEWELQIMYGLHGETELEEHILEHLEGYRASRPVRVGNAAASQFQLEVYGELINTGYELARRKIKVPGKMAEFLAHVADHVQDVWERPDSGIWELHTERHFTYSKVMAWVALDRAIQLATHIKLPGDESKWKKTAREIRQCVLERGYNEDLGSFVIAFESQDLDAANLRIPLLEFLPPDDRRVQGTINRTLDRLTENGLVYRFETNGKRARQEAGFGLCTFWMVDALCLSNRLDEARELLDIAASRANHLLLMSEQFDPLTGEMLGNFPQAFTHIGLVNSVLYVAFAEGREGLPESAPIGSLAHRELVDRDW